VSVTSDMYDSSADSLLVRSTIGVDAATGFILTPSVLFREGCKGALLVRDEMRDEVMKR